MPDDPGAGRRADAWLRRALGNLVRAQQPKPPEGFWEDLCFDAQQAAEKALKAVMVGEGIDFPRTHHLAELLVLLRQAGIEAPPEIWEADRLSDYAVGTRYPVDDEPVHPVYPVEEADYREAVRVAEQVVRWAAAQLDRLRPDRAGER